MCVFYTDLHFCVTIANSTCEAKDQFIAFIFVSSGIVQLWNSVCKVAPPNTFSIVSCKTFKHYLYNSYSMLVSIVFDVNLL